MKAIMLMYDSLNRHMLPPYGGRGVHAPNFTRLAERSVMFDTCYVGSMPCMPARRELHTGRLNFLHRSWGPIEPFDDSMPQILKEHDIYTHLVSDHNHYWEDGGATYHARYSSFEFERGQELDPWKGVVGDVDIDPNMKIDRDRVTLQSGFRHNLVNRAYMSEEVEKPQARTVERGIEFMRANATEDHWFLQIETFDPHEPYHVDQRFRDLYPSDYSGPNYFSPPYGRADQPPDEVEHVRREYAAVVSRCDYHLGRVLDEMDRLGLWEDTMLIVNTDHGFLLGEHDFWAKCVMPWYEQVARIPLFIWDPRCRKAGERRRSLVQTIDLAPTLLEFFDLEATKDMLGKPLSATIRNDTPARDAALFGQHGGHVNCTDGRYVYMRGPADAINAPLFNYTLMPTHMRHPFPVKELQQIELASPFAFTKGCPTMKIESYNDEPVNPKAGEFGTLLFDLDEDPGQLRPIEGGEAEAMMISHLIRLLHENDAPKEQFQRLGLRP